MPSDHARRCSPSSTARGRRHPSRSRNRRASTCDIVWVVDSSEFDDALVAPAPAQARAASSTSPAMADDEAAESVRALHPAGIVAYADAQMATASALAERSGAGLPRPRRGRAAARQGHPAQALRERGTARAVVHRRAGPPRARSRRRAARRHRIPGGGQAAAGGGEPRHPPGARRGGVAARHGGRSSPDELVDPWWSSRTWSVPRRHPARTSATTSPSRASCPAAADQPPGGDGPPPQVEPFRETGLIIPTDFDSVAGRGDPGGRHGGDRGHRHPHRVPAHRNQGHRPKGPRVIEVNGRIGGFVPQVLRLASPGTDLFDISRRVALGRTVVFPDLVPTTGVGYVFAQQPPIGARQVAAIDGLDRLADYPGVDAVALSRPPGDRWTGARGAMSTSTRCWAPCPPTRTCGRCSSSSRTR